MNIICLFKGHQWQWLYSKFQAVCKRCHKRIEASPDVYYDYGDDVTSLGLK